MQKRPLFLRRLLIIAIPHNTLAIDAESRHTRRWFTPHMWMGHVTHVDESRKTCGWVMSHVWRCLYTWCGVNWNIRLWQLIPGSWSRVMSHTHGWVTSHIWMGRAKQVDESCHTYEGVSIPRMWGHLTQHTHVWHDTCTRI